MIFCDAFWNSRAQSFVMYLVRLMCSWAVVCDVYYLEPVRKREDETDIDFSNRVKKLIADRISLQNTDWDGYLKHFKPSTSYVQKRQQAFAKSLLQRLSGAEGEGANGSLFAAKSLSSPGLVKLVKRTKYAESAPEVLGSPLSSQILRPSPMLLSSLQSTLIAPPQLSPQPSSQQPKSKTVDDVSPHLSSLLIKQDSHSLLSPQLSSPLIDASLSERQKKKDYDHAFSFSHGVRSKEMIQLQNDTSSQFLT